MIFDNTNIFSDDQAITATAASTNVIDLGSSTRGDIGKGLSIPILVQVTTAFATLTSLTVGIQTDSVENFASPKTLIEQTVALASLTAGAKFGFSVLPLGTDERYLRIYYTVTGSEATAGKVTAGIVPAVDNRY